MNASELRIGNYVSNPPLSECRKIDYLDIRDHAEGRLILPFEPIPITEEWLLKFGFEIENTSSHSLGYEMPFKVYRKDRFTYNQIQARWWLMGDILDVQPEYVHQLQNLYFALTGKELELNTSTK